jgi:polysaccharide pyruvyl transferase WcaK-like protein
VHIDVPEAGNSTPLRVLLAVWSGHGNIGDDLLAEIATQQLSECQVDTILDPGATAQATAVSHVWPGDRSMVHPASLWRIRALRKNYDAIALVGGFLSDDRTVRTLLRWAVRLRLLNLPVISLGCGFGPIRTRTGRILMRRLGALFIQPACFRTEADVEDFQAIVPNGRAQLGVDPAVMTRVQKDNTPRVGTIISLPPVFDHHQHAEEYSSRKDELAKLIRSLPRPWRYVSFQRSVGEVPNDSSAWQWLELDEFITPDTWSEAASLMQAAEVVVAGRLHAGVLAAAAGTPIISIAYHRKFAALEAFGVESFTWRDVGVGIRPVSPSALSRARITRHEANIAAQLRALHGPHLKRPQRS